MERYSKGPKKVEAVRTLLDTLVMINELTDKLYPPEDEEITKLIAEILFLTKRTSSSVFTYFMNPEMESNVVAIVVIIIIAIVLFLTCYVMVIRRRPSHEGGRVSEPGNYPDVEKLTTCIWRSTDARYNYKISGREIHTDRFINDSMDAEILRRGACTADVDTLARELNEWGNKCINIAYSSLPVFHSDENIISDTDLKKLVNSFGVIEYDLDDNLGAKTRRGIPIKQRVKNVSMKMKLRDKIKALTIGPDVSFDAFNTFEDLVEKTPGSNSGMLEGTEFVRRYRSKLRELLTMNPQPFNDLKFAKALRAATTDKGVIILDVMKLLKHDFDIWKNTPTGLFNPDGTPIQFLLPEVVTIEPIQLLIPPSGQLVVFFVDKHKPYSQSNVGLVHILSHGLTNAEDKSKEKMMWYYFNKLINYIGTVLGLTFGINTAEYYHEIGFYRKENPIDAPKIFRDHGLMYSDMNKPVVNYNGVDIHVSNIDFRSDDLFGVLAPRGLGNILLNNFIHSVNTMLYPGVSDRISNDYIADMQQNPAEVLKKLDEQFPNRYISALLDCETFKAGNKSLFICYLITELFSLIENSEQSLLPGAINTLAGLVRDCLIYENRSPGLIQQFKTQGPDSLWGIQSGADCMNYFAEANESGFSEFIDLYKITTFTQYYPKSQIFVTDISKYVEKIGHSRAKAKPAKSGPNRATSRKLNSVINLDSIDFEIHTLDFPLFNRIFQLKKATPESLEMLEPKRNLIMFYGGGFHVSQLMPAFL